MCTAAELPYANEVWRLLDPGHNLIPRKELRARLISVPKGTVSSAGIRM